MPKANEYSCLQVWVDAFTGWIEAFPCHSKQAKEVIKILIHGIIPRFGLPWSMGNFETWPHGGCHMPKDPDFPVCVGVKAGGVERKHSANI